MNPVITTQDLSLNSLIRVCHSSWTARGKWQRPTLADSVAFVGEEVDELSQLAEQPVTDAKELTFEAFDVYMMCLVSADLSGSQLSIYEIAANPDYIIRRMVKCFFRINRARLRCVNGYTRNNPQAEAWEELANGLSEMASLANSFVQAMGANLNEVGTAKLAVMEEKRK